ncbi:MAG: hypothetical protein WAO08_30235, partial [Hyphomicrobiaceae bacterium]
LGANSPSVACQIIEAPLTLALLAATVRLAPAVRSVEQTRVLVAFATEPVLTARDLGKGWRPCPAALAAEVAAAQNERPAFP